MVKPDRRKWMVTCSQQGSVDLSEADRLKALRVDFSPPVVLKLALALQHVLVQVSLSTLVLGALVEEDVKDRMAASVFFYSGICTLLQSYLGSRLPLVQAPSLDFLVPALVLLSAQTACRGHCEKSEEFEAPTHPVRELQGMAVVAGLVQLLVGCSGLSGVLLTHCGPLILTPVLCILGFSVYREAALLCSDHWGLALLTVVLLVFLSQHLRSCSLPACPRLMRYPIFSMLSVLLSMLLVWTVCAALYHCGHIRPHSVSELLLKNTNFSTIQTQDWAVSNSSSWLFTDATRSWLNLPLPGTFSKCGSVCTVQLAGVMLLVLGVFSQLTHLLTSIPLAIHGAVLSVTYTVAAATGITYLQYTDVDSGRNIFNTGFTVFMSLVVPRWFRMQSGFISSGEPSLDIFLQSCLMLPVFLVGVLAFFLDNTVSGSLSERGFEQDQNTKKMYSLADKPQGDVQSREAVYEPPELVRRVLGLPGLRIFPFFACRSPDMEETVVASSELSSLLPQ
ncbi:hypothetical protein NFI96_025485 [Prochilodus magdalenae]|nr:hypothetical protein NFI96_025485 [Prochilodus magdalenae]